MNHNFISDHLKVLVIKTVDEGIVVFLLALWSSINIILRE